MSIRQWKLRRSAHPYPMSSLRLLKCVRCGTKRWSTVTELKLGGNMFQSNALWPPGVCSSKYGDNISTDKHATETEARYVCIGLDMDGFGSDRQHFPVKTWVSPVQDPPQLPQSSEDSASSTFTHESYEQATGRQKRST